MIDGLTSGIALLGYCGIAFSGFLFWAERWTKRKYPDAWIPYFWWGMGDSEYSNRFIPFGWMMIVLFLGSIYCIYLGLTGQQ